MNEEHATAEARELLGWENLGAQPAGRAFVRCLVELLARPGRFFGKMATTGGLHEPLTFFAIVLGACVLLAFGAALTYLLLSSPDPERLSAKAYAAAQMPARVTGLLAVLLPLVLAAGGAAMVALGSLFYVGAKPFGARNWEGSVSIWLYAGAGALACLGAALAVIFAVSLVGCLAGMAWPGATGTLAQAARWVSLTLLPAGIAGALVLLVRGSIAGCTGTFDLEASVGAAAALGGLVLVAVALAGCLWCFHRWGMAGGVAAIAACVLVASAVTAFGAGRSD